MPPGRFQHVSRVGSIGPRKDRLQRQYSLACLPIIPLIFGFPQQLFLNIPVLIGAGAMLVWALLRPLRHAQSFLRKLFKIIVATGIILDLVLLVDYTQRHPALGLKMRPYVFGLLIFGLLGLWWVAFFWILFARPKRPKQAAQFAGQNPGKISKSAPKAAPEYRVPKVRFPDVGGMEEAKREIRDVVISRIHPERYARYGLTRNGILLYGPRGSGKTYLAEATAGEFGLNFHYVSPTKLVTTWVGESEANIRGVFARAMANRPVLLFIDEIDSLGGIRQNLGGGGDPGGAGRSYNNMAIELMQSIDQVRGEPGFIVMAATNVLDGLDEALVREGRFDVKIHVALPDEATRERMFAAQLAAKPWTPFALKDFARRTPGASAAKIRSLVDQAASFAAQEGRKIREQDLSRALEESGGKDRPLFQPVQWEEVVLDERVEKELHTLIRLVGDPFSARRMGVHVPTGVLLLGPPGTGKTMIARLIATQSKRSFLPITSAEVTEPKAVTRIFSRARESSPSVIFIDEMDSLMPANQGYLNQYYIQIVEQFLIEISNLQPEHNVLLVGTTNHPENIDPRVLRGGRFSEKIEIGLPGPREVRRLLDKYLSDTALDPAVKPEALTKWLAGITPADLEAMIATAKRYAFERSGDERLDPLTLSDFEKAAVRVLGEAPALPSALSNPT